MHVPSAPPAADLGRGSATSTRTTGPPDTVTAGLAAAPDAETFAETAIGTILSMSIYTFRYASPSRDGGWNGFKGGWDSSEPDNQK